MSRLFDLLSPLGPPSGPSGRGLGAGETHISALLDDVGCATLAELGGAIEALLPLRWYTLSVIEFTITPAPALHARRWNPAATVYVEGMGVAGSPLDLALRVAAAVPEHLGTVCAVYPPTRDGAPPPHAQAHPHPHLQLHASAFIVLSSRSAAAFLTTHMPWSPSTDAAIRALSHDDWLRRRDEYLGLLRPPPTHDYPTGTILQLTLAEPLAATALKSALERHVPTSVAYIDQVHDDQRTFLVRTPHATLAIALTQPPLPHPVASAAILRDDARLAAYWSALPTKVRLAALRRAQAPSSLANASAI